jgi:serine/threonine protein kinase
MFVAAEHVGQQPARRLGRRRDGSSDAWGGARRSEERSIAVKKNLLEDAVFSEGERFGKYVVERRIGRGGMGEVYLARDTFLDRQVAIKVLPLERGGDARFRERMQREAAAAARVEHPNLVRVYDAGVTDDDIVFLVMEYLGGAVTLRERARGRALGWDEFAAVSAQLADALASVHTAGVVHRDLKPENAMTTPEGRVVLIDFGLAKVRTHALRTTVHGLENAMSPHYSSPEQLLGNELGPATDVYSLAVVLWELAAGMHPFQFARGEFPSVQTVSIAHVFADIAPLSAVRPDAPAALVALLARALAKDPAARPTAAALGAELRALVPELCAPSRRSSALMTPRGTIRLPTSPVTPPAGLVPTTPLPATKPKPSKGLRVALFVAIAVVALVVVVLAALLLSGGAKAGASESSSLGPTARSSTLERTS